jgi:hypothetical protein
MTLRHTLPATLLALAGTVGTAAAADDGTWDYWVRVQASATMASLDGKAAYSKDGLKGTSVSTSDIALDSSEISPVIEVGLGAPLFDFGANLGYATFSTSGDSTLTEDVNFGGQTYLASTKIRSESKITDLYVEGYWAPIALNLAGFSLGVAVHKLDVSASLDAVGQSAKFDESAILPTLAVRAYVSPLDMLEVEAMVHGLAVPFGDASGSFLYAQAQVAYYPIENVGVIGGYRRAMIDVEIESGKDKAVADVSLSGPYLGLAAQF